MKKIYLSGAVTGHDIDQVRAKFDQAEQDMTKLGYIAINPLKNGLNIGDEWKKHMVRDIETLFECQAIYLLPDYKTSRGARIEEFIAIELGLNIIKHES